MLKTFVKKKIKIPSFTPHMILIFLKKFMEWIM